MIEIIKKNKPDLKNPHMLCDVKISEKLDQYELTSLMNTHTNNLIIGRPGSGKTSFLYALFKDVLKKCYYTIILFQPEASGNSIKNNMFKKLPEEQIFFELTNDTLKEAEQLIINNNEKYDKSKHKSCIIFDDMAVDLKDKKLEKTLKKIIFNRRHNGITIYFLTQTYFSVFKEIRRLFSNVIVFETNFEELQTIINENYKKQKLSDELIYELINVVYDKPHNFLMIGDEGKRLFKNFDEIIIK